MITREDVDEALRKMDAARARRKAKERLWSADQPRRPLSQQEIDARWRKPADGVGVSPELQEFGEASGLGKIAGEEA